VSQDDEYKPRIADYARRHHVKPGLTGAAQVVGLRGEISEIEMMVRRVERDLWYINNWSVTLDLKLMLRTVWALWAHTGY
jgi:undecaprenyl-phosphate galactose phosphotransferase/putative colanic acid biosynthesis UDP-glucose lipid carrier transferase